MMRSISKGILLLMFFAVVLGEAVSLDERFIIFPQLGLALAGDIFAVCIEIIFLSITARDIFHEDNYKAKILITGTVMAVLYGIASKNLAEILMLLSVPVAISCVDMSMVHIVRIVKIISSVTVFVFGVRELYQCHGCPHRIFFVICEIIMIIFLTNYILRFVKRTSDIVGRSVLLGNIVSVAVQILLGTPCVTTQILQAMMVGNVLFTSKMRPVKHAGSYYYNNGLEEC